MKAALGMALEELEKPKAKERMSEGGRKAAPFRARGKGPESFRTFPRGDVRDIVGSALGVSGRTYKRGTLGHILGTTRPK